MKKHILVLLSVVALMVGMMVVTVAPAFASGYGKDFNWGHWCGQDCGTHGDYDKGTHGDYDKGTHGTFDWGWHGEGNSGVGNIP
jgi:hypothetical protein